MVALCHWIIFIDNGWLVSIFSLFSIDNSPMKKLFIPLLIGFGAQYLGEGDRVFSLLVALVLIFAGTLWMLRSLARRRLLAREKLYDDYNPEEFEQLTAEIFRRLGYKASVSGKAGDRGLDVILRGKKGQKIGVQCKHYQPDQKIGSPTIREFIGALDGAKMQQGYFVTTADYTREAIRAAKVSSYDITLISGEGLARQKKNI